MQKNVICSPEQTYRRCQLCPSLPLRAGGVKRTEEADRFGSVVGAPCDEIARGKGVGVLDDFDVVQSDEIISVDSVKTSEGAVELLVKDPSAR